MNKYTKLFNQKGDEVESKKLPNLMNKGKLALENYINNAQLKLIEKETLLEKLDYQFVKGDAQVIPLILSARADVEAIKDEIDLATEYKDEMFKETK